MLVVPDVKTAIGLMGVRLIETTRDCRIIHVGENRVQHGDCCYALIMLCSSAGKGRNVDTNLEQALAIVPYLQV